MAFPTVNKKNKSNIRNKVIADRMAARAQSPTGDKPKYPGAPGLVPGQKKDLPPGVIQKRMAASKNAATEDDEENQPMSEAQKIANKRKKVGY